jgi:type IV pilus assembly protein PilM
MNVLSQFRRLVEDPPPAYAFEISQAGIAFAHQGKTLEVGFHPLEPDVLLISPLRDNLARPEMLFQLVQTLAPTNGKSRRRTAALILPDYSARVAVLDFDAFPSNAEEQLPLVRHRIKKSIPFDLDSARVSYSVQTAGGSGKKYQVVVAVASLEIVARYEAAFRSSGLEPGYVTTSTLAALNLLEPDGIRVVAKLSGGVLSVLAVERERLKLARCVELAELSPQEVMGVLYPTFAYVEDQMAAKPNALVLCGFGALTGAISQQCEAELGVEVKTLQSRFGEPDETNAGLFGYLESMRMKAG